MAKSEVYSWRLDPEMKMALDLQARMQGTTLSEVLNSLAKRWLEEQKVQNADSEAEQVRLRGVAAKYVGSISGGDPYASEKVREIVRKRIKEKHAH
jgi:hypothetical protein